MRTLALAALLLLAGRARADGLSEATLQQIRFASQVELRRVLDDRVLARGELEPGRERDRLVKLLGSPSGGPVAACWVPRHEIVARDGARSVVVRICFECNQLEAGDERGTAPRNAAAIDAIFARALKLEPPADPALDVLTGAAEVELLALDPDESDAPGGFRRHEVYGGGLLDEGRRDALRVALALGMRGETPEPCHVRKTYGIRAGEHAILLDPSCGWIQLDGGPRRPFAGKATGGLDHLLPPPPRPIVKGALSLGNLDFDEEHGLGQPDGPQYPALVFHLRGVAPDVEPDELVLTTLDDLYYPTVFIAADAVTREGDELLVRFPPVSADGRWLPFNDDDHELIVLLAGMPIAHRSLYLRERHGSFFDVRPPRPWTTTWLLIAAAAGLALVVVVLLRRRRRPRRRA